MSESGFLLDPTETLQRLLPIIVIICERLAYCFLIVIGLDPLDIEGSRHQHSKWLSQIEAEHGGHKQSEVDRIAKLCRHNFICAVEVSAINERKHIFFLEKKKKEEEESLSKSQL